LPSDIKRPEHWMNPGKWKERSSLT
jgi:hypothetical protein